MKAKRREPKTITLADVAPFLLIAVIAMWIAAPFFTHRDYRMDIFTGTTTWTDEDGRKMMRSRDGSVRELSR